MATVWLSSQGGTASGTVCVWGLGPNTNNCTAYTVTPAAYTPVQIVFDAHQNTTTVRLQIYPTPNVGTTDLDTVSLR